MKYANKCYGNKKREAYVMFNAVHSLFSYHLVPTPILRSVQSQFLPFVCQITNAMHTLQNNSCQKSPQKKETKRNFNQLKHKAFPV